MGTTQKPDEPQGDDLVDGTIGGLTGETRETAAIELKAGLATILQGAVDILKMVVNLLQGLVDEVRGNPGTLNAQLQGIINTVPTLLHTVQDTIGGLLGGLTGKGAEEKH